jgi:diguanylate cyclase (GGDEF)-like protein/PAS domain S-box-containing protein
MLEKREHLILQGLFDAVITTDDSGNIHDFNTPAERMFGYTEEEIFGCNVKMLMPEAYSKMHDKFLGNYTSTGETKVMGKGRALLGKRKDGSVFPIDVALTEFRLDNQRIFIGTIRDITRQKEYENALLRSQQELEERVQQRTKDLHDANEKLEQLASYDTLTGLANRYLFTERFKQELAYARRHKIRLALLYMDLDGFKKVNDSLGHKFGDILLKTVAERLHSVVREEDIIARLGGDEFALVANHINDPADAVLIARKIITAINQPILLNNQPVDIGISIGISCFPNDGSDMETLLHRSDTAMYHAKHQGKNCYFPLNEPA